MYHPGGVTYNIKNKEGARIYASLREHLSYYLSENWKQENEKPKT